MAFPDSAVTLLFLVLPRLLYPATLPSGARNDCPASQVFFGPCLPGTPATCPSTCPPGCACLVDSCCYPRNNQNPNPAPVPQSQPNSGGGANSLLNLALLMLLFRQRTFQGYGGWGLLGCQDAAWNCFRFAPMCLYSARMLSFCPRTCGACGIGGGGGGLLFATQTQIALANALGNGALLGRR